MASPWLDFDKVRLQNVIQGSEAVHRSLFSFDVSVIHDSPGACHLTPSPCSPNGMTVSFPGDTRNRGILHQDYSPHDDNSGGNDSKAKKADGRRDLTRGDL